MDDEKNQGNDINDSSQPQHVIQPTEDSQSSLPVHAAATPETESVSEQPQQPNPVPASNLETGGQQASPVASESGPAPLTAAKKSKSKLFLPLLLAGFLLFGGAAAAYVGVIQKSPENLWKSALNNTAKGLDTYLQNGLTSQQKGFKTEGTFKVSSPVVVDGTMSGQWYESNGSLKGDIGASGVRMNMELVTNAKTAGATPDVYMKVSGLEGIDELATAVGTPELVGIGSALSGLNDQWYFIDHTLIDQSLAGASTSQSQFSEEEMKKVADNMMIVMKDRMFTTAKDKAIFTIDEQIGKEEFEGTDSYKMRVKVNQANFKEFVVALKDAAKGTKLEELVKMGQTDKTIEEALDFDNLIKELETADFSKLKADVWVEGNGRYVRNVRFYPDETKMDGNYLDFGMKYEGGDVFPLLFRVTIDDEGTKGALSFGFDINQKNSDVKMTMNVDMNGEGQPIKAEASLSINGSDEQVSPETPTDAKSILELISDFQSMFLGSSTLESGSDAILYGEDFLNDSTIMLDDTQL